MSGQSSVGARGPKLEGLDQDSDQGQKVKAGLPCQGPPSFGRCSLLPPSRAPPTTLQGVIPLNPCQDWDGIGSAAPNNIEPNHNQAERQLRHKTRDQRCPVQYGFSRRQSRTLSRPAPTTCSTNKPDCLAQRSTEFPGAINSVGCCA